MTWPTKHLTADDLDAFHSGSPGREMKLHLETCTECRDLVALDQRVLGMMAAMPSLAPSAQLADRIMARVQVSSRSVPVLSYPALTRRRLGAIAATVAGMAASVAWTSANRTLLDGWLTRTGDTLIAWGLDRWNNGVALLTSEPWFETLRIVSGTPARLALIGVAALMLYGAGIVALRRLVTPANHSA